MTAPDLRLTAHRDDQGAAYQTEFEPADKFDVYDFESPVPMDDQEAAYKGSVAAACFLAGSVVVAGMMFWWAGW